jgi:putative NADPH-quinone reductase
MARITIIDAHPDADPARLGHALCAAYAEGAAAAGHDVRTIRLCDLDVPLLAGQEAFEKGETPASLLPAQHAVGWATHLVIVFPLWLGGMPALLKAFLEQVMRPGFAFAYEPGGRTRTLLGGRSAHVVVTMGMPGFVYRWFFLGHGVKALTRSILRFTGIRPVRTTYLGGVGQADDTTRRAWLARMTEWGRQSN